MPQPPDHSKLMNCLNCGNDFHGHYCNHCGQDAHTGKIDRHFLYHEIQHGFFHVDGGIFYTIKELFVHPGEAIRLFIQGKRVRHFKPLAFLLIMAGLYTFLNHFVNASVILKLSAKDKNATDAISQFNEFIKEHYAIYELLQLPLLSFVCYLVFKKYGTNFMEQLVVNAYLGGMCILIKILFLPLSRFMLETGHPYLFLGIDLVIPVLLFVWAFPQYYKEQPYFSIFWRSVLAYVLNFVLIQLVASIVLTLLASSSVG
jgi:hypothetical protein